ncbi:cuticle protein 1-like [Ctenocephalides felis]|uniref:cuticle protein 1-like n=1 Tax=Ctenocephalides felis TaxID=7515 RepID=UPI000E6E133C|nr:cuticle protein 1-like [Ctenocephalides felis]
MVKVLAFSAICLAVVYGLPQHAGARYPAGVNPALCPGYPHCDNLLLAQYAVAHAPVVPVAPIHYDHHDYHGVGGAKLIPAGVDPSTCPNYPYCDNTIGAAYHAPPLPGFAHRLYPDGVSAYKCPNYPFCH